MNMQGLAFLIALLGLSAVWIYAMNTSIKALRLADPGLYRAAVSQLSGLPGMDAPFFQMLRWMRRQWRHHDVRKHRAVRRWMYVHHAAHSALIGLFGFGLVLLIVH